MNYAFFLLFLTYFLCICSEFGTHLLIVNPKNYFLQQLDVWGQCAYLLGVFRCLPLGSADKVPRKVRELFEDVGKWLGTLKNANSFQVDDI